MANAHNGVFAIGRAQLQFDIKLHCKLFIYIYLEVKINLSVSFNFQMCYCTYSHTNVIPILRGAERA